MIYVTAFIESIEDNMFIGYIKEMKGLVVQSTSEEGAKEELIKSVRVKLAYDYNLDISNILNKGEVSNTSFVKDSDQNNTYKVQLV